MGRTESVSMAFFGVLETAGCMHHHLSTLIPYPWSLLTPITSHNHVRICPMIALFNFPNPSACREYITTSRNCVSFVRCARWMNGSNREVLLAVMAIMGHSLLEASAAMVDRNRAGQLSLVESSYSGTYWPRPLEW